VKEGPAASHALMLKVPSRTEFLALVRDVTRRMAELAGFDGKAAEQIALAVDEAATNVIEHAYRGATDRSFEIRYEDRGKNLEIDVVDEGARVAPESVPKVDLQRYASERRTGGLGIHLMSKIMDSVSFERSGRHNVCRLVKRRPGASDEARP
jgi:serine/threonine-protein kinase RsbW